MPDFIDKDEFLKDVLPECKYPVKLIAAVERQPIVHIDDMTFKIQNELQAAHPSGIFEITFVKHGRWLAVSSYDAFGGDYATWCSHGNPVAYWYCSECKEEADVDIEGEYILSDFCPHCGARMGRGDDDD